MEKLNEKSKTKINSRTKKEGSIKMKGKISSKISLLLTLVFVICLNNCTATLAMIGQAEDKRTPDIAETIPGMEAEKIKSGSEVIVNLKDGAMIEGKYVGVDSITNEQYDEEYAELQKQMPEGSFLPTKGDTIKASSEFITNDNVKFSGLDKKYIILSPLDINSPTKFELKHLENITDKDGNKTDGKTIRNLISEGKFPSKFLSGILIKDYKYLKDTIGEEAHSIKGKKFISLKDIDQIQIKSKKHATRNLLMLGFVLDALIIAYPWFVLNSIFSP
jgi:small nuclear ribonucleoprotein (snRNP)-like protein